MKTTAKDLRFHTRELLETVDRGEEVIITYRGKPRARLVPYSTETKETVDTELFGMWKERDDITVDEYVRNLRKGRF